MDRLPPICEHRTGTREESDGVVLALLRQIRREWSFEATGFLERIWIWRAQNDFRSFEHDECKFAEKDRASDGHEEESDGVVLGSFP